MMGNAGGTEGGSGNDMMGREGQEEGVGRTEGAWEGPKGRGKDRGRAGRIARPEDDIPQ